jgi:DNA-binding transcriptional LysR family regulator
MPKRVKPSAQDDDLSKFNIDSLVLFYRVVNCGSINRAATQLQLSKTSISRKLRQLEQQIGTVLVKRGVHQLAMTSSGEAVYRHCERILAEVNAARTEVAEMQSGLTGKVAIATAYGLGGLWVTPALATFALQHPQVQVVVHETSRWVDVSEEPYDIAIHLGRVRNERLPVRRFAQLQRGVFASPAYFKLKSAPRVANELLGHSCIALQQQLDDGLWTLPSAARAEAVTIEPRVCVSDIVVARDMALAGVGLAILPRILCRDAVTAGRLVEVLTNWEMPPLVPSATYLERRFVPLHIRAVLETIAAQFKQALEPPTA